MIITEELVEMMPLHIRMAYLLATECPNQLHKARNGAAIGREGYAQIVTALVQAEAQAWNEVQDWYDREMR